MSPRSTVMMGIENPSRLVELGGMTEATKATRRGHFKPDPSVPFRLQERDLDFLEFIAQRRYASSEHVEKFFGVSRKAATNRLGGLFHKGFLARPLYQRVALLGAGGSVPRQVHLTSRGARLLEERRDRKYPHGITAEQSYRHFIGVADVYAHLSQSARERGVSVLWDQEIMERSPEWSDPNSWKVTLTHERKHYENLGIKHDGMFAPDLGDGHQLFLLEFDRGTEQFRVDDLYKSTIAKKLVLYRESLRQWSNNRLKHPYGIEYPVVLFVVDTEKMPEARIAHIQRKAAEFGIAQDAPNLFLFTTAKALLEHNFLDCPWQNLKGKDVFLS